jgi:peptide/nickel transport system substrate-binding protein
MACEGPSARSKPWRHQADPTVVSDAGADDDRARERQEEAARRARTLRIRLQVEPSHLNPLLDIEHEGRLVVEDTIYEGVLRYERGANSPNRIIGHLAEYNVMPGGMEIRLVLRQGVTFHDGRPLTSHDVGTSLDAVRGPSSRSPRLRALLADVLSVDVWGPRDIRLPLRKPNGYVLRALTESPIVPAGSLRAPIGTGPYRLHKWAKGDRITLTRYDGYWRKDTPVIPTVEFIIIPDGAEAMSAAKRGKLDILAPILREHWPAEAAAPGIEQAFDVVELKPPRLRVLALNSRRPPFDDVRVRRAAVMLVDRDRIARDGYGGLARPASGLVWPGGPLDAEGPPPPPYDFARAIALLEDAGWRDPEKRGVRERGGAKLRVTLLATSDQKGDQERDLILGGFRRAGFVVDVRPGEPQAQLDRLRSGDFELALVDVRARSDDDVCPYVATKGALNLSGLSSKDIDGACDVLIGTWDPSMRSMKAGELSKVLQDEWPFAPIVQPNPRALVSRRVKGAVVKDGWFVIRGLTLEP